MPHTDQCICGDRWRFETCDLATGQIKGVLHPISATWEEKHSQPGQAQILLATREYVPDDIWAHDTSLYISQVIDGKRVGRWAGLFETYSGSSRGDVTVGLQGIDEYLDHRNMVDEDGGLDVKFTSTLQSRIAADLVSLAVTVEGIPLVPVAGVSTIARDRTYNSWDLKNIGEAINELTNVINGVKYYLTHEFDENTGRWRTVIHFQDSIGDDRGIVLRGDIEGAEYGVTVDAKDHATWVYAIGEGEEVNQKLAVAFDEANQYPRFHAVPAWKDVSVQSTLNQHASGYVADYRDPISTPTMSIPGMHPVPEELQLGDRVLVQFDYGLVKFNGFCYIQSIAWSLKDGSPVMRDLAFQPEDRPNDSVRIQRATTAPSIAPSPAPGGAVSNFKDPRITDSAGMTHSKTH